MYNFSTTITNEGAALLARIIANHENAAFKEARMSETNYVGQEATLTAGTFGGVKYTDPTIAASVIDSTTIKVAIDFRGSGLIGEYNLYSIGIIIDDNGTDVLVAVCTSSDPLPIGEEFNDRYAFNVNLAVSSTQNITVTGTSAAVLYDIDVVDTLISTATDKPLSANMGRVLGENIEAIVDVYGAKNILSYPYVETTKSENAVTFTDNGDGTVTVSGTASADTSFIFRNSDGILKKGTYIFSGCPSGGTISTYKMVIYENGNFISDYGNGTTFTIGSDVSDATIYIIIKGGTAITTPITFKPMIRDARIVDDTFVPFAKTNRELTELSSEQKYTNGSLSLYKKGNLVTLVTNGWVNVISGNVYIPAEFRPYLYAFATVWGSNGPLLCQISDTGAIQLFETYPAVPTPIDDHFMGSMSWYTT